MMTPEQFCYWLQGYFELSPANIELGVEQTTIIKEHLALVFDKITPTREVVPINTTYCTQQKLCSLNPDGTSAPTIEDAFQVCNREEVDGLSLEDSQRKFNAQFHNPKDPLTDATTVRPWPTIPTL